MEKERRRKRMVLYIEFVYTH